MMMQDLNFQDGGAAGGSVAVGTVAGGGLPTNTAIATLSLSLALVPIGLIAVAVFPPFVRCVHNKPKYKLKYASYLYVFTPMPWFCSNIMHI